MYPAYVSVLSALAPTRDEAEPYADPDASQDFPACVRPLKPAPVLRIAVLLDGNHGARVEAAHGDVADGPPIEEHLGVRRRGGHPDPLRGAPVEGHAARRGDDDDRDCDDSS